MVGTISHDFVTNVDRLFNFRALVPACRYLVVEAREQLSPRVLFPLPDSEQRWKVMRGRRNSTAQVANIGPDWLFLGCLGYDTVYILGFRRSKSFHGLPCCDQRKHVTGADFSDFSKNTHQIFIKITTLNNYSLSKYSMLSAHQLS